jgi:YHS domain-containing protein
MKLIYFALIITLFSSNIAHSQPANRIKNFNLDNGLAVKGYDVVAYFNQNKAVKGNAQFSATVEGVTYYFSNLANRDQFQKDYKKFEPQYGGWCAYAMGSSGEKVEIDPETFKIESGKLYLFYHTWINNTLSKWNKDEMKLRNSADKNWQTIFH